MTCHWPLGEASKRHHQASPGAALGYILCPGGRPGTPLGTSAPLCFPATAATAQERKPPEQRPAGHLRPGSWACCLSLSVRSLSEHSRHCSGFGGERGQADGVPVPPSSRSHGEERSPMSEPPDGEHNDGGDGRPEQGDGLGITTHVPRAWTPPRHPCSGTKLAD